MKKMEGGEGCKEDERRRRKWRVWKGAQEIHKRGRRTCKAGRWGGGGEKNM
jgi:hypothetical protein